jgi:hypothetical protein
VPPVDRWPRVAAATAQARGGLGESVRQHFEDGDSPGQCGGRGPKQWHLSATEALRWSPAEEKRLMRLTTRRGFLKNRERGIGASKSIKNPHGCTVHHGGEKFEFVWLMALGQGRCSPEAEGGRRAPVWLLRGGGEVGCHQELNSMVMVEGCSDGFN